jgi:hypothetical protein
MESDVIGSVDRVEVTGVVVERVSVPVVDVMAFWHRPVALLVDVDVQVSRLSAPPTALEVDPVGPVVGAGVSPVDDASELHSLRLRHVMTSCPGSSVDRSTGPSGVMMGWLPVPLSTVPSQSTNL